MVLCVWLSSSVDCGFMLMNIFLIVVWLGVCLCMIVDMFWKIVLSWVVRLVVGVWIILFVI